VVPSDLLHDVEVVTKTLPSHEDEERIMSS
jgi:hypothetical protein